MKDMIFNKIEKNSVKYVRVISKYISRGIETLKK